MTFFSLFNCTCYPYTWKLPHFQFFSIYAWPTWLRPFGKAFWDSFTAISLIVFTFIFMLHLRKMRRGNLKLNCLLFQPKFDLLICLLIFWKWFSLFSPNTSKREDQNQILYESQIALSPRSILLYYSRAGRIPLKPFEWPAWMTCILCGQEKSCMC